MRLWSISPAGWIPWGRDLSVTETVRRGGVCTASSIFAGCVNGFCRSDSFSDCWFRAAYVRQPVIDATTTFAARRLLALPQ